MHRQFPLKVCLVICSMLVVSACVPIPALRSRGPSVGQARETVEPAFGVVDDSMLVADVGALDVPPSPVPSRTPLPTMTSPPTSTQLPSPTTPPTSTPDPLAASGVPSRLQIPAIGVDAFVEQVGLTVDRAMDVPSGWQNVGWYMLGSRPGELGNAVIAGHFDNSSGGPAVFWDLSVLTPGDEIIVTYENGDQYTFMVQDAANFEQNAEGEVIDRVFGEAPTPNLNLITCQGAWDRNKATYSERLVVFTSLMPERTVLMNVAGAYD